MGQYPQYPSASGYGLDGASANGYGLDGGYPPSQSPPAASPYSQYPSANGYGLDNQYSPYQSPPAAQYPPANQYSQPYQSTPASQYPQSSHQSEYGLVIELAPDLTGSEPALNRPLRLLPSVGTWL